MMRGQVLTFAMFAVTLATFAAMGAYIIARYVVAPIVGIGG